jgi:hypothetical protein
MSTPHTKRTSVSSASAPSPLEGEGWGEGALAILAPSLIGLWNRRDRPLTLALSPKGRGDFSGGDYRGGHDRAS